MYNFISLAGTHWEKYHENLIIDLTFTVNRIQTIFTNCSIYMYSEVTSIKSRSLTLLLEIDKIAIRE